MCAYTAHTKHTYMHIKYYVILNVCVRVIMFKYNVYMCMSICKYNVCICMRVWVCVRICVGHVCMCRCKCSLFMCVYRVYKILIINNYF